MRRRCRRSPEVGDWLTLQQARDILGISPSTLRRWGDSGEVRTFVTPGGHRRFSRPSIEALLPGRPAARPSLAQLGETTDRMARAYHRATAGATVPWLDNLATEDRTRFREEGSRTATALMAAIDAPEGPERERHMAAASESSGSYGVAAGSAGLGPSATAETFLQFRLPFLAELATTARRRDLDAAATTQLLEVAIVALDELLLAMLRGWERSQVRALQAPPSFGTSS
jgi:hypothetical protein